MRNIGAVSLIGLVLASGNDGLGPPAAAAQEVGIVALPPPATEMIIRAGRRTFVARLSMLRYFENTTNANAPGPVQAMLSIEPADGLPMPADIQAYLTVRVGWRTVRVPLNQILTLGLVATPDATYAGTINLSSRVRVVSARVDMRAGRARGWRVFSRVRIGAGGPLL